MLHVRLSPSATARTLCVILAAFVLCYVVMQILSPMLHLNPEKLPARAFDLDGEQSLSNYFQTMLLLAASILLALVAVDARAAKRPMPLAWAGLAVIFLLLSIDENISIHEGLGRLIGRTWHLTGALHYAWVIPYGIIVLLVGAMYTRFLLRLPRPIGWWFVLSGAVYVGGALGVEMIDGIAIQAFGGQSVTCLALVTLEETMEGLGAILFIYSLLRYAAIIDTSVTLSAVLPDRRPVPHPQDLPSAASTSA